MIINAIAPDFHKPQREDMHGKAAQELNTVQGKGFFNGPVSVILGNESHLSAGNVQNTLVCYSYPVRILPKIFNHVFSICQGRFTIYNPSGV